MNVSVDSAPQRPVLIGILCLGVLYGLCTWLGWTTVTPGAHGEAVAEHAATPHVWSVLPFVLMLAAIAIFPLAGHLSHWWESNLNKLYVAVNLAILTLAYLAWLHPQGSLGRAGETLLHTIIYDYIPFIVLLFSLYTIAGGIRIAGDLPAHSLTNSIFLLVGAVLASVIGTTGAAMLLIRPLLETNRERKQVRHTVVFFIFVVCNCGGLLLPLGDPPLFLGYLNGVDFLWTLGLWRSWLLVNGLLIATYFLCDHFWYYPHETQADLKRDEAVVHRLRFAGIWPNALLLLLLVLSVALLDSSKPFPGTNWHPWLYLREMVMLALVAVSLVTDHSRARQANRFNYVAIVEVGVLFVGIFVCMQPALEILHLEGAQLGLAKPAHFFWASGSLSSVLDNAPTYLVFFKAAQALPNDEASMAGVAVALLRAISLGSVMMGAMTYIGNGPNFMVKAIAEAEGVKMPSFFGYLLYSFGILLPILVINTWLLL